MNEDLNTFVNNYRQSLQSQYDVANSQAATDRQTAQQQIMSNANKAGSMYSNFTERAKTQYDTGTYLPSIVKNYSTYQTGLDKLRSNIADYQNNIKTLEEAIASLNGDKYYTI